MQHEKQTGGKLLKIDAMREVKAFIQNVHNFRDECLIDPKPPREHVALFDEAQRAWDLEQTAFFMRQKKNTPKKYPIVITRDLAKAKSWLKSQARGSERYGIVVSSQA